MLDGRLNYDNLFDFVKVLREDIEVIGRVGRTLQHPCFNRSYARAVFACIEGEISGMAAGALAQSCRQQAAGGRRSRYEEGAESAESVFARVQVVVLSAYAERAPGLIEVVMRDGLIVRLHGAVHAPCLSRLSLGSQVAQMMGDSGGKLAACHA